MLKRLLRVGAMAAALVGASFVLSPAPALAGGYWQNWPGIGYSSYCSAIVGSSNVQGGTTGQGTGGAAAVGTNGVYCAQTTPAGPTTFAGTEYLPLDIGPLGVVSGNPVQSAVANISQLGQGNVVVSTASTATLTIPAGTGFFVLDTGTAGTVAITMPASAIEGQIAHIDCKAAVGTALSVAANTGQTIVGNTPSTCTAGQGFAWRYMAVANGSIVAGSWLRIW